VLKLPAIYRIESAITSESALPVPPEMPGLNVDVADPSAALSAAISLRAWPPIRVK